MKTLFVSNYSAYGDHFSVNGMINFLSFYYDKIFILSDWKFCPKIEFLYKSNDKVQLMAYDYFMFTDISQTFFDFGTLESMCLLGSDYDSLDSTCIGPEGKIWGDSAVTSSDFNAKNVFSEIYNEKNPIGNKLGFNIPKKERSDLISHFYNNLGLPDEIKYKCFNFNRSYEDENKLIEKINPPDSYAVVCEYDKISDENILIFNAGLKNAMFDKTNIIKRKYIDCDNIINIHMISKKYFDIIKLIENAKEVHLIENSITMMVYFLQLSGRMKRVPINLHVYYRKENYRKTYYETYMRPKLYNWNFIFE